MGRETIREGLDCPLCRSRGTAVLKETAKGMPYVYGRDCCNAQLFARSADQAAKMRAAYGAEEAKKEPVRPASGLMFD